MDFVAIQLFDGRRFGALTVVNYFSRKCLAIHLGSSIKVEDVRVILARIATCLGQLPQRIQVDNSSEFISKIVDQCAYEYGVTLDFSRPGNPTDNSLY